MSATFSAGVDFGGLRSMEDIKLLVCYLLYTVKEPVPRPMILEIISGNGMANFFDTGVAIDKLIELDHIAESGSGMLTITNTGTEIAEVLSTSLPFVLRERSVKIALTLLLRMHKQKDANVEIEKTETGYNVTLELTEAGSTMMKVTVATVDSLQANAIRENFLEDPALLYRSTFAVLNGQTELDAKGKLTVLI